MVGPDRRERRGGKGRGGDERDGEKQRAAHASFTAVVATPATGASKASRLPAQGWAASRSGVSPFCAVVTKRVRMSGPPKQGFVRFCVGSLTVRTSAPSGEKRARCQPRTEEHTSELQSLMRIPYA